MLADSWVRRCQCAQTKNPHWISKIGGGGKPDRLPGLSYQKDCDLSLFFLFIYFFIFLKTEQADFLCKDLHQIAVIRSSSKSKDWIASGRFVKVKVGKLWESIFYLNGSYECWHLRKCMGQKQCHDHLQSNEIQYKSYETTIGLLRLH